MSADEDFKARVKRSVVANRRLLNRIESHLGCVVCRGDLIDGVCPVCDPPSNEGEGA